MKNLQISLAIIVITAVLTGCGEHKPAAEKSSNPITDSLIKTLPTAPVTMEDVSEEVRLNGYVAPDDTKQAKVYALVSGKISAANFEVGDYVTKGQQLAVLQSTEVANMSNDISLAQSNVDMTKKNMETTEDLYKSSLATEKDFVSAKLEYNKALSELNRANQVSAITGGSKSQYILKAPISGYVIEKNLTNNSEVREDNNSNLFTIADLSTVWVMANVYESDINNIHVGDAVKVVTLASPDTTYIGKIDKIYNVLDPQNRTMKVRVSMSNPHGDFKPAMFATVVVKGKAGGTQLAAIPSGAVVMNNSLFYVVVKSADGKLEIKPVKVLKRLGTRTFISGLNPGEQVVTQSQVFLFEALNTK